MNKIIFYPIYFTIFILVTFLFIIPTIWCFNPSILLNTKIRTVSQLKIEDIKEPAIYICSHDETSYTYDQLIMLTEILKNKITFNIGSEAKQNRNTDFLKSLPLFQKYNLMHITGEKDNIVKRSKDLIINKKQNVLFFLKKDSKSKGIFHILKDLKIPIIFVKILSDDGIYANNIAFNRKFKLEYEKKEDYETGENPEDFMEFVKENIYLNYKNN